MFPYRREKDPTREKKLRPFEKTPNGEGSDEESQRLWRFKWSVAINDAFLAQFILSLKSHVTSFFGVCFVLILYFFPIFTSFIIILSKYLYRNIKLHTDALGL